MNIFSIQSTCICIDIIVSAITEKCNSLISCYYLSVLSAKDVIPLDANGLSDPYVVVTFCPEHLFPTVPSQTTKIVKKTLNPEFDESFELYDSLTLYQMIRTVNISANILSED